MILLPKDCIRFRFTERFATDVTDAVGSQMFEIYQKLDQSMLELYKL